MNLKIRASALAMALCIMLGGISVSADDNSTPQTAGMIVNGYTVTKGGSDKPSGKIEKGDRVAVAVDVKREGLTTESAGKINVHASSDSFRLSKDSPKIEVLSKNDEPLSLRIRFSDAVYKGSGDAINFKVTYADNSSDTGEVHIYECVEKEASAKDSSSSSEDKSEKKDTNYGAPLILISRTSLGQLTPGEPFQIKVRLQNVSPRITASNVVASFETSDGVTLQGDSASRYIRSIRPKRDEVLTLNLRANKEVTSPSQSVTVSLKFDYVENDQRASSTASEKLLLPFNPDVTGKTDIATPNLIVSKYNYGERVAVGEVFDLSMEFKNTNPEVSVENIILSLETGEGLSVSDSSNTFYYPALPAGGTQALNVKMQALPNAKPESPRIDVSFKYEYVTGEKRTQVTNNEKIAIPVYQPDRFKISPPTPADALVQNEEASISLPYVNKGKSEISNVEAELTGNVEVLEKHQNLGNFEAGKSGTIDFLVTPREAGEVNLNIKVTYEDSNMKVKTLDFPVRLNVEETHEEPMVENPEETEPPKSPVGYLWLIAGAGLLMVTLIAVRIKRRKKRESSNTLAFSWDDDPSGSDTAQATESAVDIDEAK